MYFNIKCIGKSPGPTNEFERSLVLETGEFERPKFDCMLQIDVDQCLTIPTYDLENEVKVTIDIISSFASPRLASLAKINPGLK